MPIAVDYTDKVTLDDTPVLEGTCNQRNADIEAIIRVNPVTGGPDDTYNTKAIGGQWAVATEELVRPLYKPFTTSGGVPPEDTYLDIFIMDRLKDGRMCGFFRKGSGHASDDGRIFFSTSSDEGQTWTPETLVYDSPTGYDTRNQSGGVCPVTGNIIIFLRVYDAVTPVYIDVGYVYSTDNGQTWSSFISVASELPTSTTGQYNVFGKMIETSNGLMQTFYHWNDAWVLFSTDNGLTWGNAVTMWTAFPDNIGEPWAYPIDSNRIVCIVRDNVNTDSYRYIKSTDGGATWGALSDPYPWTDIAIVSSAPVPGMVYRGQILAAITGRNPEYELHSMRLDAEDFWDRPEQLWSVENVYRVDNLYAATASAPLDWGYCTTIDIKGHPDTALMCFYDDDGAVAETSLYMRLFPLVS